MRELVWRARPMTRYHSLTVQPTADSWTPSIKLTYQLIPCKNLKTLQLTKQNNAKGFRLLTYEILFVLKYNMLKLIIKKHCYLSQQS